MLGTYKWHDWGHTWIGAALWNVFQMNKTTKKLVTWQELLSCKILYFTPSSEHQLNKFTWFTNWFYFHRLLQTQETSQKYQLSPEALKDEKFLIGMTNWTHTTPIPSKLSLFFFFCHLSSAFNALSRFQNFLDWLLKVINQFVITNLHCLE